MTTSDQLPPPPAGSISYGGYRRGTPVPPGGTALATVALSAGIVAVLFGWVTFLGGILGSAGIILGVRAVRAGRARVRSIIGLCLSGVALLCNITFAVIFILTR